MKVSNPKRVARSAPTYVKTIEVPVFITKDVRGHTMDELHLFYRQTYEQGRHTNLHLEVTYPVHATNQNPVPVACGGDVIAVSKDGKMATIGITPIRNAKMEDNPKLYPTHLFIRFAAKPTNLSGSKIWIDPYATVATPYHIPDMRPRLGVSDVVRKFAQADMNEMKYKTMAQYGTLLQFPVLSNSLVQGHGIGLRDVLSRLDEGFIPGWSTTRTRELFSITEPNTPEFIVTALGVESGTVVVGFKNMDDGIKYQGQGIMFRFAEGDTLIAATFTGLAQRLHVDREYQLQLKQFEAIRKQLKYPLSTS